MIKQRFALILALLCTLGLTTSVLTSCSVGSGTPPGTPQEFTCSESEITSNASSPLGTNLGRVSYFDSSQYLFVDQFAKSSDWFAGTLTGRAFEGGTILAQTTEGWPTSLAADTRPHKQLFSGLQGNFPTGTYAIEWDGSGGYFEVDFSAENLRCSDGGTDMTTCSTQKAYFDVNTPTDTGISISIIPDNEDAASYGSSGYITNIRVIMPGGICGRSTTDFDIGQLCETSRGGAGTCDSGETCYDFEEVYWNRFADATSEMNTTKVVFHPTTIQALQKYSTIRFMQAFGITGSSLTSWSDRPELTDHSAALEYGIPFEYAIALINTLDSDGWFSIPHLADDSFITSLATLLRDNVETGREIYTEYTNEHWNTDPEYTQSNHMLEQAIANNLASSESEGVQMGTYYATRAQQIFTLFNTVFSGQTSRLTHVVATDTTDASVTSAILGVAGITSTASALAIAGYAGSWLGLSDMNSTVEKMTLDDLFDAFLNGGLTTDEAANGSLAEVQYYIDQHLPLAQAAGLDLVAYEMGQGLTPIGATSEANTTLNELFRRANRDARMYDFYLRLLQLWAASGATLGNHYQAAYPWTFSTYGLREYQESPIAESPKYCALLTFMRTTSCWWNNCD